MSENEEKPNETEEKKTEEQSTSSPAESPSSPEISIAPTEPQLGAEMLPSPSAEQITPSLDAPISDESLSSPDTPISDESLSSPDAPISEESVPEVKPEFNPDISAELEQKMQEELAKKKEKSGEKTVTREAFIEYLKPRRSKVMYFALWHMAFNVDDHKASKKALYESLGEVTSTSPIEPLAEHKFYFGLKYILKLKLFDQPVVEYIKDKLKIQVNIENLQEILKEVGEPISTRPIMTDEEKKGFIDSFLNDDFNDL